MGYTELCTATWSDDGFQLSSGIGMTPTLSVWESSVQGGDLLFPGHHEVSRARAIERKRDQHEAGHQMTSSSLVQWRPPEYPLLDDESQGSSRNVQYGGCNVSRNVPNADVREPQSPAAVTEFVNLAERLEGPVRAEPLVPTSRYAAHRP